MKKLAATGMIVGLMGLAILLFVDWRIAAGVFICMFGNNMERSARRADGEEL